MDAWFPDEEGSGKDSASVPMNAILETRDDKVNVLCLEDVLPCDLYIVRAWLFAMGFPHRERETVCRQIMGDGFYAVSNIEYRLTIECTKQ